MVEICIGSACHIKGSYEVIKEIKRLVEKHGLEADVELKSSFCLGKCGEGVSVRIDGEKIYSVNLEEVEKFFYDEIMRG